MTITPERLAAFADGELPETEARMVEALVAQDAELARQVAAHRALRQRLSAHYAPILNAPLPDRLVARLAQPEAQVVNFVKARESRDSRRGMPRWTWMVGPALAASLVLAVVLPVQDKRDTTLVDGRAYAAGPLAETLDSQLSANQPASVQTRILISFKDSAGAYCRGFSGKAQGGIACRDQQGWQLRRLIGGAQGEGGDYRQAGSQDAELMALAQHMAPAGALDAVQEQAAKAREWQ